MTPYDPSREPDFWTEVPAASPNGAALPAARAANRSVTPAERMRRLLRGRTTLALVLALAGGLIGASMGWSSQQKQWQATGWIRIEPVESTTTGGNDPVPFYRQFMFSEVQVLEEPHIAAAAMEKDVWKQIGQQWTPGDFAASVDAKYTSENSYIYVHFVHSDPRVAEAGATAAILAYEDFFLERKARADTQTIAAMRRRVSELEEEIKTIESAIDEQARRYRGIDNLQPEKTKLESSVGLARTALWDVERNLALALESRDRVLSTTPLSIEQLALGSLELSQRLGEIELLKRERENRLATGAGMNHPQVRSLTQLIDSAEYKLQPLVERVRKEYFGEIPNPQGTGTNPTLPLTAAYIESLELQRDRLQASLDEKEASLELVVRDERRLADLRNDLGQRKTQLSETNQRITAQEANSQFQQETANIVPKLPDPQSAYISRDRRKHMALAGAVFGFGAPIGAIILIGLLDRRFRYSEDAAEAGDRFTLLGILPNLPDRLSDPNQASIAAHCVHQIRTILQINHGSDESRAFAITSASRGDGKTSLALALGLSYAASGARTLLLDTDLQHGGLSTRLGITGDEGIMDALTGGELLRFVCETDVADLAILPIGRAAANHAGAFSPAAVRHLLEQAKRRFDVIVCDTGPILGSNEATPIPAAFDGVVVAV
jgi:Mrp family chromosome partitioning ATPase